MDMTWITLVLLVVASFRLTHLIVFDAIMEPVRNRLEPIRVVGDVITCFWCCGVWVSAGLVGAYWLWPAVTYWVALVFAVAGGQALIETFIQRQE